MKVQIHERQGKSLRLAQALASAGAQIVSSYADVYLVDFDGPINPYPSLIQRAYEQGAEIVLFSHGAPVITAWDGIWKPGPLTRLFLAQSPGEKWVMNAYKYPYKVEVIGWHFCSQKPFTPCPVVKKVLYAPEHPHGNGYITSEARILNRQIYDELVLLPYELTVRHVGPLAINGFPTRQHVKYQLSDMMLESSIKAIDEADLIVSNPGTFATLAVARGKPLVMYGQDICPHDGYSDDTLKYVKHWDDYRDYMRYPYDISRAFSGEIDKIFAKACEWEAVDWRLKFINKSLEPANLVKILRKELRL